MYRSAQRRLLYNRWYRIVSYRAGNERRGQISADWSTFEGFLASVAEPPNSRAALVRIDDQQPFGPNNYRWGTEADRRQQLPHAHRITYRGKVQSAAAWARELRIDLSALYLRLKSMPAAKALKLPKKRPRKNKSPLAPSRHVGVSRHSKCRRWEAKIRVDGKLVYLGLHPTERMAANAIVIYRNELAAKKFAKRIRDMVRRGAKAQRLLPELQELIWMAQNIAHFRTLQRDLRASWERSAPARGVPVLTRETVYKYTPNGEQKTSNSAH